MWFRNRLVNPVVRLLLRSPLHPVLSRSLVILSYQGRKTGRWRSLPCIYARDGQDLYVVAGQPGRTAAASSDPEAVAAAYATTWPATPRLPSPLGSGWTPTAPPRHDHRHSPAGRRQPPP